MAMSSQSKTIDETRDLYGFELFLYFLFYAIWLFIASEMLLLAQYPILEAGLITTIALLLSISQIELMEYYNVE